MNLSLQRTFGLGFSVSVYRRWCRQAATYRYVGANWMHPYRWWNLSVGWHVDHVGRLYLYLGRLCLYQDVWPLSARHRRLKLTLRHFGPLRISTNTRGPWDD